MPQSLCAAYLHLVFSTKGRTPWIGPESMADLHAYLGGVARKAGCPALAIGGTEDHVHLLVRLTRTLAIADLVREVKSASSSWMKTWCPEFAWQGGYAGFSVGIAELPRIRKYIESQQDHHRLISFEDEFLALLREHDLEWDERYIWD